MKLIYTFKKFHDKYKRNQRTRKLSYYFNLVLWPFVKLKKLIALIFRPIDVAFNAIINYVFLYPFRSLKNLFRSLVILLAIIYIGITSFTSYLIFSTYYLNYQQEQRIDVLEAKLKKSVVRIVGGFSEGSGFFIAPDQIMTSFHVIDGEPSPKIIFPDGHFITPTKIIGDSKIDLAVLYIKENFDDLVFNLPQKWEFILRPKDTVISAGYPLGTDIKGPPTIIQGNCLNYREMSQDKSIYIQTDFDVVKGMSGGPLVNTAGEVVGINTLSLGGQSLFISAGIVRTAMEDFTDKEIAKLELDPSKSPEDAVTAYYSYLQSRQMKKGYELLSSLYLQYTTFEEWTNRFRDVLDVNILSAERYKKTKDTVYVEFQTKNWVNGEVEVHSYQGTWKTVLENGIYKLQRSNIEEVVDSAST